MNGPFGADIFKIREGVPRGEGHGRRAICGGKKVPARGPTEREMPSAQPDRQTRLRLRMERNKARQRHSAELDHVHGRVECGLLLSCGLASEVRKVEMLASRKNVFSDKPTDRLNLIEPSQPPLTGMTTITVIFKYPMNVRWHLDLSGCRSRRDAWP